MTILNNRSIERCAGYAVKSLNEANADTIYSLYKGNPQYFAAMRCEATLQGTLEDLTALPPGKTPEDKHFWGFYKGQELVAVMDLIEGYPDAQTAFIGLFMVSCTHQGCGTGSAIIEDMLGMLKDAGFVYLRLGWVEGNAQSEAFWKKNGFVPTGVRSDREEYTVIVAQKNL